jgi:2-hydroxy-3-keto-5-methylthiopentenyl-1-phosphate phosphatase
VRVVLDWDGTVTAADTLDMALAEFGEREVYDEAERALGRGWTLQQVMDVEFGAVRAPLDDVIPWLLDHVRVRPGFRAFAERFDPLILSSSFVETIEPILEREGVRVRVVANSVDARRDGWRIRWRDDTVCAHCSEACKRRSLPRDGAVVFVGDGYSDRCAGLAADRVFARDGLARYLDEQGVAYERFHDFVQLADALAGPGPTGPPRVRAR